MARKIDSVEYHTMIVGVRELDDDVVYHITEDKPGNPSFVTGVVDTLLDLPDVESVEVSLTQFYVYVKDYSAQSNTDN